MAATTPSVGPGRHEARERAISLLYESEMRDITVDELLGGLPLEPDAYAVAAISGIDDELAELDTLIDSHSDGWSVARMPGLDRAILRLAAWELRFRPDVPAAVAIDEAVELAKEYSTERSPRFINGVLDSLARAVR